VEISSSETGCPCNRLDISFASPKWLGNWRKTNPIRIGITEMEIEILALFILFAFFFPLIGDRAPYHLVPWLRRDSRPSVIHPGITDFLLYDTISATPCQN
jgi:hypothetical protein